MLMPYYVCREYFIVFYSVALVKTINFLLNILAIAGFVSNWV